MQSLGDFGRMLFPATVPTNITSVRRSNERFVDMAHTSVSVFVFAAFFPIRTFPGSKTAQFYFKRHRRARAKSCGSLRDNLEVDLDRGFHANCAAADSYWGDAEVGLL